MFYTRHVIRDTEYLIIFVLLGHLVQVAAPHTELDYRTKMYAVLQRSVTLKQNHIADQNQNIPIHLQCSFVISDSY